MNIIDHIKHTHKVPLKLELDDFELEIKDADKLDTSMLDIRYNASAKPIGPQGIKGEYEAIKFDSKWEYYFYRWCKDIKGYNVDRNKKSYIPYTDESSKLRKFYPDFIVNGQFYEVKGIWRPSDIAKRDQCPTVTFLDGSDLKPLIKELKSKFPNVDKDYLPVS